jgi:hypothetical protein
VLSGKVDAEVAANAATNRHDFLVSLEQASKRQRADQAAAAAAEAQAAPPQPEAQLQPESQPQPLLQSPAQVEEGFGLRIAPAG